MERARGSWRALVGAGKGGGNVNLARRRPEPGARRGGHYGERAGGLARRGGRIATRRDAEGAAPLYGGQESTATSLGVKAGLGRSERQWGQGADRWSVGRSRPDGASCEEGDSEATMGRAWLRRTSLGKTRGGSDVEAAYSARAGALARWSAGDVTSA
jgi:hypothetical protein